MKKLVKLGIAAALVGAIAYSIPPVRERMQAACASFQEDFENRERQLRAALMPETTPLS
ncbi:hypothetical protein [Varibaculum prostatecancerukia]|uniref:hypothetical protein n=1 Tax=Varibaculum prostatecancerukia TaxID=2811781 RepID=UPI001C0048B4|nr:hypothetical protein [Varibaculum prostatecancerukia]